MKRMSMLYDFDMAAGIAFPLSSPSVDGSMTRQRSRTRRLVAAVLLFIIGLGMYSEASAANSGEVVSYGAISFTPDSRKLVFHRCNRPGDCQIHILDLNTKALFYYKPQENQQWFAAKFSPSGKQVVFVAVPTTVTRSPITGKTEKLPDFGNGQIAIMDADGGNFRLLTNSKGYKMAPNFSWSGTKVLFTQAEMRKPGSKTLAAGFDAYEIDLKSGNISQLTSFRFFQMGRPSYLPGDERFVVAANGPSKIPGVMKNDVLTLWKVRDALEKKHNNSWVYLFNAQKGPQVLQPRFGHLVGATSPSVDAHGNLYFWAQLTSADRIKLFRSDAKGNNLRSWDRRLPNMQPRFTEVSPDGRFWAVISRAALPDDLNGIYLLDLASDQWEEVHVPMKANLINP